ncbi:hypothetical protein H310_15114, partial [Aphanomyces invadans]
RSRALTKEDRLDIPRFHACHGYFGTLEVQIARMLGQMKRMSTVCGGSFCPNVRLPPPSNTTVHAICVAETKYVLCNVMSLVQEFVRQRQDRTRTVAKTYWAFCLAAQCRF